MVVWYIEKEGEFVGVITREEPLFGAMRRDLSTMPGCRAWWITIGNWHYLDSTEAVEDFWKKGTPPESVLMAKMIGE